VKKSSFVDFKVFFFFFFFCDEESSAKQSFGVDFRMIFFGDEEAPALVGVDFKVPFLRQRVPIAGRPDDISPSSISIL